MGFEGLILMSEVFYAVENEAYDGLLQVLTLKCSFGYEVTLCEVDLSCKNFPYMLQSIYS